MSSQTSVDALLGNRQVSPILSETRCASKASAPRLPQGNSPPGWSSRSAAPGVPVLQNCIAHHTSKAQSSASAELRRRWNATAWRSCAARGDERFALLPGTNQALSWWAKEGLPGWSSTSPAGPAQRLEGRPARSLAGHPVRCRRGAADPGLQARSRAGGAALEGRWAWRRAGLLPLWNGAREASWPPIFAAFLQSASYGL